MDGAAFYRRWAQFNDWERSRRRAYLRTLTIEDAARIFNDLWELTFAIPPEDIHRLRMRKIARLAKGREALEKAIRKRRR